MRNIIFEKIAVCTDKIIAEIFAIPQKCKLRIDKQLQSMVMTMRIYKNLSEFTVYSVRDAIPANTKLSHTVGFMLGDCPLAQH